VQPRAKICRGKRGSSSRTAAACVIACWKQFELLCHATTDQQRIICFVPLVLLLLQTEAVCAIIYANNSDSLSNLASSRSASTLHSRQAAAVISVARK
jgi:hypothetical protein